jgi:GGDEF-like domain
MSKSTRNGSDSLEEVHAVIVARLRSRGTEIAEAVHASIPAIRFDLSVDHDAEYQAGRVAAVTATIEYSLNAIERGGEWESIPRALVAQAHRAARMGVRPGVLVRHYLAGHRRFMNFIVEEIKKSGHAYYEAALEHLHGTYRPLRDHIIDSVEHEYHQEFQRVARSPEQRRAKLVRQLLLEEIDPTELGELEYDLGSPWHLGIIALGVEGQEAVGRLKTACGHALLHVPGDNGTIWAWLATNDEMTFSQFRLLLSANGCSEAPLAIGDPGNGLDGWRQTHEEARVAVLMARRELSGPTRCADVLPIAGALQSQTIIRMYKKAYTLPLNKLPQGGQSTRKALLAYFKHDRSASCAAEAIKATDRTIRNHLKEARKALDVPLNLTALEIALRLEELGYMSEAEDVPSYSAMPLVDLTGFR